MRLTPTSVACIFSGEYDLSGRPQDTERVSDRIDGAQLETTEDMGHFPPSENLAAFKNVLMPVVEEIVEDRTG